MSGFNSAAAILGDWNGAAGAAIIPEVGVNTNQTPRKIVDDIRVQKEFAFGDRYKLQVFANVFNVANHQNYDGINSTAYKLTSGSTSTQGIATFQPTYQQLTSSNNSGFLYTPREIEIATRFSF